MKALFPVLGADVAPRFDRAVEVVIVEFDPAWAVAGERTVVLPQPSAEDLCQLVVSEGVGVVVCGGIEDEYHQYLTWKKVRVIDSVMGPFRSALRRLRSGRLEPGDVLFDRAERGPPTRG